jgi:metal-sulfur cluster biosynthetic enzyme
MTGASLMDEIARALDRVIDPCSVGRGTPAGLRDMGMVTDIGLQPLPDGGVCAEIELRTTSPACTFHLYFEQQVRAHLASVAEVEVVNIRWNDEFDWTDDDMSDELKRRLREKRELLQARLAASSRARVLTEA